MCKLHNKMGATFHAKPMQSGKEGLPQGEFHGIIGKMGGIGMKDFPFFTMEYGVVSLVLKEIPYRGCAYVKLLQVQPGMLEALLEECVSFCRMAGAEKVLVSGEENLDSYPLYTAVLEMRMTAREEAPPASLFPVTEQTAEKWRAIYNEKMRDVDNAATLETRDEKKLADSGGAYFVHRDGELLGIGWLEGDTLLALASTVPGMGQTVAETLLSLRAGEPVRLEVASTNDRAIRLYERLGFLKTREVSRWYQLWPRDSTV